MKQPFDRHGDEVRNAHFRCGVVDSLQQSDKNRNPEHDENRYS